MYISVCKWYIMNRDTREMEMILHTNTSRKYRRKFFHTSLFIFEKIYFENSSNTCAFA